MREQDAHARSVLGAIAGCDRPAARMSERSGGMAIVAGVLSTAGQVFYQVRRVGADKFGLAARLQKANHSRNPIPLPVSFDGGHGLGSTRCQIDDERADEFAFELWRAGRRSFA